MTFKAEMAQARQRVAATPSSAVTTRWGEIEYVDDGDGVPVLLSHGVLGGHDNTRALIDLWVGPDVRAIGPARFGYLGSTMPDHATPADQADTYAALLDHVELERVVVFGFSAGGPAAIQLALRHPERLHGLVLGSSYLPGMARPLPRLLHPVMRAAIGWERGWWLLKTYRPALLARIMGVPKGWDTTGDTDFLAIRDALFPIKPKQLGVAFDALVSEPASDRFPLEAISVPTLVVHAADDRLAPYEHVPPAAARIPDAKLVTIDAGGHLYLGHGVQARTAIRAFIAHLGADGSTPTGTERHSGRRNTPAVSAERSEPPPSTPSAGPNATSRSRRP
jgi:pimeloyl-ACP methyl ester carboxylesterase